MKNERITMQQTIEHANHLLANLDSLTTQNKSTLDSTLASLEQTMDNLQTISDKLVKSNNRLNSILAR